jgi:hypothetical protein
MDSGRYPGLFLLVTGTSAFFDGPQGHGVHHRQVRRRHLSLGKLMAAFYRGNTDSAEEVPSAETDSKPSVRFNEFRLRHFYANRAQQFFHGSFARTIVRGTITCREVESEISAMTR